MTTGPSFLAGHDRVSAVFKPGASALGHHWELVDGDGTELGRTKLFYEGAGKTVGRLMRATGLSTSGTIHARVLDAEGTERYRIHSQPGKDKHVTLADAADKPVGSARRDDLSLELFGPDGEGILARIVRDDKDAPAFPIETADGTRIGVLSKSPVKASAPSISAMLFAPQLAANQTAFQATMHLGFAGSFEYHLLVEARPPNNSLATLLSLSPVIAGLAY